MKPAAAGPRFRSEELARARTALLAPVVQLRLPLRPPLRPMALLSLMALLLVLLPEAATAQVGGGAPSLRPYWHVFIAYAIGWGLVLGWIIAIARRLARVEERLARQSEHPGS